MRPSEVKQFSQGTRRPPSYITQVFLSQGRPKKRPNELLTRTEVPGIVPFDPPRHVLRRAAVFKVGPCC